MLILFSSHLLFTIIACVLLFRMVLKRFSWPGFYATLVFLAEIAGQLILIISIGGTGQITPPFDHLLDQNALLQGFICYLPLLAYFCEIRQQRWLTFGKILFFIVPIFVLSVGLVFFPSKGLDIHELADIKKYIYSPNLWIRLSLAGLYILYGFHCVVSSVSNWRQCIVPKSIITIFRIILAVLGVVFLDGLMLGHFFSVLMNWVGIFFVDVLIVYIELYVRINAVAPELPDEYVHTEVEDDTPHPFFDNPDIWMNPDMSAVELARLMGTNQKYLTEQIKARGFVGYSDMINRKRVLFVCEALKSHPDDARADIGQMMFDAGFRSRSTANSEFKRIIGCTPSEYIKSLK